jgi:hypothetical protein
MRTILVLSLIALSLSRADLVECENGDRYNGKVLLVDEHNVKLQNEIAGILNIPRSKVSTITFGAPKPSRPIATAPLQTNTFSPSQPLHFDQTAVDQVQNQFLGDASPEAAQMFQDLVRGLASGKLDLGDIKSKAQSTLNELKDLQKDLGDDDAAALLSSYASILENFVKQAPAITNKPPATSKPGE